MRMSIITLQSIFEVSASLHPPVPSRMLGLTINLVWSLNLKCKRFPRWYSGWAVCKYWSATFCLICCKNSHQIASRQYNYLRSIHMINILGAINWLCDHLNEPFKNYLVSQCSRWLKYVLLELLIAFFLSE